MALEHNLAALQEHWGDAYDIGWNFREQLYQERRRDNGEILSDTETEELWKKIRRDYIANPVPRLWPASLSCQRARLPTLGGSRAEEDTP